MPSLPRSRPSRWRSAFLGAACSLGFACGREGEVSSPTAGADAALPSGHPATGTPAAPESGAAVLAGEIEFAGELATVPRASVFVIGFDAATNQLVLVDKLELATAARRPNGELALPFALGTSHLMSGGRIGALELEVRVDLDGLVDGPDDVVGRTRIPVGVGDRDVRVRLDDGARTLVPLEG